MKTREYLAKCGHAVVVTHLRGRHRRACDACGGVGSSPCPNCGKLFHPTGSNMYCCLECRWEYLGIPAERPCQRDGCMEILGPTKRNYCSLRCGEISHGNRLAEPYPEKVCALPECGVSFVPYSSLQHCCTKKHGKKLYNAVSRAGVKRPPQPWTDARRDSYHRRRAAMKGTASSGAPVLLAEIGDRDGWECGICGRSVDPEVPYPDQMSKSLDHIIPLSMGGQHRPENVRVAHLTCNSQRGSRERSWAPAFGFR